MTNYKILINSKGVPVLVTVPSMSEFIEWSGHDSKDKFDKEVYEQALSTALADESKWIPFKDEDSVWNMLFAIGNIKGQPIDLPETIKVSFEVACADDSCPVNIQCINCRNEIKLAVLTPESVPSCGEQSDEEKYAKALAFKLLWSYALSGRRITKFEDLEEYATEWFEANGLEIKPKAPTKH